jgi:hypothetical protein
MALFRIAVLGSAVYAGYFDFSPPQKPRYSNLFKVTNSSRRLYATPRLAALAARGRFASLAGGSV